MSIYIVFCHDLSRDSTKIERVYSSLNDAEVYVENQKSHIAHCSYSWKWEYIVEEHELF